MNFIKNYVDYLHLKREEVVDVQIPEYKKVKKLELAKLHLSYLKEQSQFQRDRQTNIENKNAQLVGQASVIVSIITLFVPLIIDKLSSLNFFFFLAIIFGFLFVLIHYLIAIIHAIKTLQINHYYYSSRSTRTLTKSDRATNQGSFYHEEISDLIFSIEKNALQNNRKGRNLVFATRSFRIATVGLVIFAVSIIGFGSVQIHQPQQIEIKSINNSVLKQVQKPNFLTLEKLKKVISLMEDNTPISEELTNEVDSLLNEENVDSLNPK